MKHLLIIFAAAWLSLTINAQTNDTDRIVVGDTVPAFTIYTLTGDSVHSEAFKGKTTLLLFFATWCGPCRLELAEMEPQIWQKYKNKPGFEMWVLGREHNNAEVETFAKTMKYSMPFAADAERRIFKRFAESQIPRCYIIGKNGTIVYAAIGFDKKSIEKIAQALDADLAL